MSVLRRIEKSMDRRLRSIFAGGREEAIELYRNAMEQIAARATMGKRGERVFPFNLITIELMAENSERKAVLETLFDPGQLVEDIRATLKEERVTPPGELTIAVKYPAEAAVDLRVICERSEQPAAPAMSPARLTTPSGEFGITQARINIGREKEVVDSLGRPIRRNEVFFPEESDEANASVSRAHAHIRFDAASGDWRIYDDGSSLGTSLFREGRRIEVPAHASRGVTLRAGDEIYVGQVRLRFDV